MIKVTEDTTMIAGELGVILGEITRVLSRIYQEMKEVLGEEEANKRLADIGRLAVMSEEELNKYIAEHKKELN